MSRNSREGILLFTVTVALLLGGCAGSPEPAESGSAPETDAGSEGSPATTLGIPGVDDGGGAAGEAGGTQLVWDLPPGWEEVPPASNMRLAQYRVGDGGECIVFYFGPGQGGDPMANVRRWAGQFTQPDGSPSQDLAEVTTLEGTTVPVMIVEVSGTYDGGMTMTAAPASPQPGYMLLGGIAEGPDAPWFFKFTGPEATISAERDAFVDMMRSIRRGG